MSSPRRWRDGAGGDKTRILNLFNVRFIWNCYRFYCTGKISFYACTSNSHLCLRVPVILKWGGRPSRVQKSTWKVGRPRQYLRVHASILSKCACARARYRNGPQLAMKILDVHLVFLLPRTKILARRFFLTSILGRRSDNPSGHLWCSIHCVQTFSRQCVPL